MTVTTAAHEGRGSTALTRDAIRLEVAMRLVIEGVDVEEAWDTSDAFIAELDARLPALEIPEKDNGERNRFSP